MFTTAIESPASKLSKSAEFFEMEPVLDFYHSFESTHSVSICAVQFWIRHVFLCHTGWRNHGIPFFLQKLIGFGKLGGRPVDCAIKHRHRMTMSLSFCVGKLGFLFNEESDKTQSCKKKIVPGKIFFLHDWKPPRLVTLSVVVEFFYTVGHCCPLLLRQSKALRPGCPNPSSFSKWNRFSIFTTRSSQHIRCQYVPLHF